MFQATNPRDIVYGVLAMTDTVTSTASEVELIPKGLPSENRHRL